MKYLLDTNACIAHLKTTSRSKVTDHIVRLDPNSVVLCSVVKAELVYGALRSRDATKNLRELAKFFSDFASLPFDDKAADTYGRIRAELDALGTPIGPNDLLIAAICLAQSLTVVTHNTAEFSRVPGLTIEDWESSS